MKRLILTGWLIPEFSKSDFADLAVDFPFRFVWGPLSSPDEFATYLGVRTPDHGRGCHWSDFGGRWGQSKNKSHRDLGLAEFCQQYETVELYARYKQSRPSLTELGQAVLADRDDFSRHNPIRRWWGGTELSNDRLRRWDPAKQALIAP